MSTDYDLSAMSLDELWLVQKQVAQLLFARLTAQNQQLDAQLAIVQRRLSDPSAGADDPRPTKAARRSATGKPIKKPDSRADEPVVSEKSEP
jgi:hypothetical protein